MKEKFTKNKTTEIKCILPILLSIIQMFIILINAAARQCQNEDGLQNNVTDTFKFSCELYQFCINVNLK